jgi:hypothetical protein
MSKKKVEQENKPVGMTCLAPVKPVIDSRVNGIAHRAIYRWVKPEGGFVYQVWKFEKDIWKEVGYVTKDEIFSKLKSGEWVEEKEGAA